MTRMSRNRQGLPEDKGIKPVAQRIGVWIAHLDKTPDIRRGEA
jgi:hypothetical protein